MGLQITFTTDGLTRTDAVTIARLLESASPGVLSETLGECRHDHTPNAQTVATIEAAERGDVEAVVFDATNPDGPFVSTPAIPFPPPASTARTALQWSPT